MTTGIDCVGLRDVGRRLALGAILQRAEARLAVRIERDELAVEDHAVDVLRGELRRELRELRRELEAAPRAQAHAVLRR